MTQATRDDYLTRKRMHVFASATIRDSVLTPADDDHAYLLDTQTLTVWERDRWRSLTQSSPSSSG